MFRVVYIDVYRMHDVEDESACGSSFRENSSRNFPDMFVPFFLFSEDYHTFGNFRRDCAAIEALEVD